MFSAHVAWQLNTWLSVVVPSAKNSKQVLWTSSCMIQYLQPISNCDWKCTTCLTCVWTDKSGYVHNSREAALMRQIITVNDIILIINLQIWFRPLPSIGVKVVNSNNWLIAFTVTYIANMSSQERTAKRKNATLKRVANAVLLHVALPLILLAGTLQTMVSYLHSRNRETCSQPRGCATT